MADRYLVLIDARADRQRALAQQAPTLGLKVWRDEPNLLIAAAPEMLVVELGQAGAVFGSLFTPGRPGPIMALSPAAIATIASSEGAHLLDAYWGHYIAVVTSPGGVAVVRPPFGVLACFIHQFDDLSAYASDVALLEATGLYRRSLAIPALIRHLAAGDVRRDETCLAGICELRGGDRLRRRHGTETLETLWSPWRFTAPGLAITERDEADRRLRDQARYVVAALADGFVKPLVLISGGLDSSIVAACLAYAERDFTCLTISTHNPTGDERAYARLAANAVGRPLVERWYDLSTIALGSSAAAAKARPVARSFEQAANRLAAQTGKDCGCDVILDGGGGDNVFCSLQSATPAADCLQSADGRGFFRAVVADIAALAQTGRWQVAWRAWRRSRRIGGYRWPLDRRLLRAEACAAIDEIPLHPWLAAPPDVLPGRGAHVAMLIAAQGLVEDGDVGLTLPTRSPLVAQPLIETALRIPSWHWFQDGNNRAAARRAFAAHLPEPIAWRRSKGTPDSVVVELFDRDRSLIRDYLTSGILAANGVLDGAAVRAAIDDPRPARDHLFVRIMQLMDAEVWARSQC